MHKNSIAIVGEAWGAVLLTQGQTALVDIEDLDRVNQFKWCAIRRPSGVYHAMRKNYGRTEFMHHFILNVIPSTKTPVDHRNRNGIDNRKINLRIGSPRLNDLNKELSDNACHVEKHGNRFRVRPQVNGKKLNLGSFETEKEALDMVRRYRECIAK